MKKLLLLLFLSISVSTINAQSQCDGFVTNILDLSYDEDPTVYFVGVTNLPTNWYVYSSTFELTFKDGTKQTHPGNINSQGNPILAIDVSCSNKVMKVKLTTNFYKSIGFFAQICTGTKTKNFAPFGACGTGGFFRISPNPAKDVLNIQSSEKINKTSNSEVVIYNLNGNIVQKHMINDPQKIQLNVSELKHGNYILKIFSNDRVIETKNIIISN